MIWNDKTQYHGDWMCDAMNGIGKMTLKDKSNYEGEFLNGKRHGLIKAMAKDYKGKFQLFECEWVDDVPLKPMPTN